MKHKLETDNNFIIIT